MGISIGPYYWPFGLIATAVIALFLGVFAVAPVYLFLKRRGLLRPWWALLAGALIAAIPVFLMMLALLVLALLGALADFLSGQSFAHVLQPWFNGGILGNLLHSFHIALWFASYGALGAAVAWLLAFGFRWGPPSDTRESD